MGGIGYALGAIATGIGDGMQQQAVLNDQHQREQEQAALTSAREIALENLRHSDATDEAKVTSNLQDARDANHEARAFAYGTATNEQKQGFEQNNIKLRGSIDLSNQKQIEGLKQQYNLTDIQVKSLADLNHDMALAGQTVDHWGVTTDGRMVAFNKQGGVLRYSAHPGSFVPSGVSENGDDLGGGGLGIPSTKIGAKPAATTPATPASTAPTGNKAQALAQAGNVYAAASQNPAAYRMKYPGMFDQSGNLLPRDQVLAKINQAYGED